MGLLAQTQVQDDVIDSIIDRPKLKPAPQDPEDSGIITDRIKERYLWSTTSIVATSAGSSIAIILGLQYGIPLVLGAIRNARKNRGKTLLDDEQFNQLMDQYSQLIKLVEQNGKTPPDIKS